MNNPPPKENKSLKEETVSSTGWGFLDKGVGIGIHFIIGIVLARLLPPSDFGLLGLGMVVIGFGEIFVNLGLGPSLIQRQKITQRHVRVVLTTSVIAGILLAIVIAMGAPVAAWILDSNQVIPIIEVLALIFIISGLTIPSRALLKKNMDFKSLFFVSLGKSIFYGSITITLALLGFGVWSLVIGTIVSRIVLLAGTYSVVRHSLKPLLSKTEFIELFHFGSGETLGGIANYFALQGDYLMVGRILGAHELGLYTKSYSLMQMPTSRFVRVLTDVLFPSASRIQNNEEKLRTIFLKTMEIIAFLTFPICVLMVLLAQELIVGLYGEKWQGAVVPLQILGTVGVFRALYNTSASFLKAKGWVYKIFYSQVIYGLTVLLGVWMGATYFGLKGAAIAVGVSIFLMWLMLMELNARALNINRLTIYLTLKPAIVLSAFTLTIMIPTKILISVWISIEIVQLMLLGFLGILILMVSLFVLPQKWLNNLPLQLLNLVEVYIPSFAQNTFSTITKYVSR